MTLSMRNSTIKTQIGKCVDCPEDSKEKPLIAKRCKHHYDIHRASVNAEKKAAKLENSDSTTDEKKIFKKNRRRSKKGQKEDRQYLIKRLQFLAQPRNQRCPITGQMTTEIHHKKGRVGKLLLDQNYWLAVSREGHRKIEENPEWAKEMGYSVSRLQ